MTDFLYDIANSDPCKAIGGLGLFSGLALWAWASRPGTGRGLNAEVQ